jgi:hypothetical protein
MARARGASSADTKTGTPSAKLTDSYTESTPTVASIPDARKRAAITSASNGWTRVSSMRFVGWILGASLSFGNGDSSQEDGGEASADLTWCRVRSVAAPR